MAWVSPGQDTLQICFPTASRALCPLPSNVVKAKCIYTHAGDQYAYKCHIYSRRLSTDRTQAWYIEFHAFATLSLSWSKRRVAPIPSATIMHVVPPGNQHLKVFGQSLRAPSIVHQLSDSGPSPSTPATLTEEPFASLNSSWPCAQCASRE